MKKNLSVVVWLSLFLFAASSKLRLQAAPEQPEARTAEGTTIQPYDETRYMLGPLCVNQHDYQGTGQSLRRRGGKHECVECKNARSRAYKERQRLARGSA